MPEPNVIGSINHSALQPGSTSFVSVPQGLFGPNNQDAYTYLLGLTGTDPNLVSQSYNPLSPLYDQLYDEVVALMPNRADYLDPFAPAIAAGVPLTLAEVIASHGGMQDEVLGPAAQLMGPIDSLLNELAGAQMSTMFGSSGGAYGVGGGAGAGQGGSGTGGGGSAPPRTADVFDQNMIARMLPLVLNQYNNSITPFLQSNANQANLAQAWQTQLANLDWAKEMQKANLKQGMNMYGLQNLQGLGNLGLQTAASYPNRVESIYKPTAAERRVAAGGGGGGFGGGGGGFGGGSGGGYSGGGFMDNGVDRMMMEYYRNFKEWERNQYDPRFGGAPDAGHRPPAGWAYDASTGRWYEINPQQRQNNAQPANDQQSAAGSQLAYGSQPYSGAYGANNVLGSTPMGGYYWGA